MKKTLTIFLASLSSLALAQEKTDLSRSVDDNGQELVIRVNGHHDGKYIDYTGTFKIQGLSRAQRIAIADRVMDSLQVSKVDDPVMPLSANPRVVYEAEVNNRIVSASAASSYRQAAFPEQATSQSRSDNRCSAMKKEIWLDDNGFLHLRYSFTKNADEYIFEKSTDASEQSEAEKEAFIKHFEEEIELPAI